jgi:hypothetical protein
MAMNLMSEMKRMMYKIRFQLWVLKETFNVHLSLAVINAMVRRGYSLETRDRIATAIVSEYGGSYPNRVFVLLRLLWALRGPTHEIQMTSRAAFLVHQ